MAQRYTSTGAQHYMAQGACPECGEPPDKHTDDPRFWIPRTCDLTVQGVLDRIAQYVTDRDSAIEHVRPS